MNPDDFDFDEIIEGSGLTEDEIDRMRDIWDAAKMEREGPEFHPKVEALLTNAHAAVHAMEVGPEIDAVTARLHERDLILIAMGMPLIHMTFPCLGDELRELQARLIEIVSAQFPEWGVDYEEDEG